MSEVDRQSRQQLLQVCACLVPVDQSVDGRGVSQVMESRLATRTAIARYLRDHAQKPEGALHEVVTGALAVTQAEEWREGIRGIMPVAPTTVGDEDLVEVSAPMGPGVFYRTLSAER